jgi:dolichol-phosphate mannosyltransferase
VSMQERNPGLGLGVRQGIHEAAGTHILLMDSDGEMDVTTVPLMLEKLLAERVDLVIGSRWAKGGGVVGYSRTKYLLNRAFQIVFRILFRTNVRDLTLGFKLCRADVMKALHWNAQYHDIGCETTLRPIRAGCSVAEVPTTWVCRV